MEFEEFELTENQKKRLFGLSNEATIMKILKAGGIIAGGSVVYVLLDDIHVTAVGDIDVFYNGSEDDFKKFVTLVDEQMKDKHKDEKDSEYHYFIKKSCVQVVHMPVVDDFDVPVQCIYTAWKGVHTLIAAFDLDYVCCGIHLVGEKIMCVRTNYAKTAHETRKIRYILDDRFDSSRFNSRIGKALQKGFWIWEPYLESRWEFGARFKLWEISHNRPRCHYRGRHLPSRVVYCEGIYKRENPEPRKETFTNMMKCPSKDHSLIIPDTLEFESLVRTCDYNGETVDRVHMLKDVHDFNDEDNVKRMKMEDTVNGVDTSDDYDRMTRGKFINGFTPKHFVIYQHEKERIRYENNSSVEENTFYVKRNIRIGPRPYVRPEFVEFDYKELAKSFIENTETDQLKQAKLKIYGQCLEVVVYDDYIEGINIAVSNVEKIGLPKEEYYERPSFVGDTFNFSRADLCELALEEIRRILQIDFKTEDQEYTLCNNSSD